MCGTIDIRNGRCIESDINTHTHKTQPKVKVLLLLLPKIFHFPFSISIHFSPSYFAFLVMADGVRVCVLNPGLLSRALIYVPFIRRPRNINLLRCRCVILVRYELLQTHRVKSIWDEHCHERIAQYLHHASRTVVRVVVSCAYDHNDDDVMNCNRQKSETTPSIVRTHTHTLTHISRQKSKYLIKV